MMMHVRTYGYTQTYSNMEIIISKESVIFILVLVCLRVDSRKNAGKVWHTYVRSYNNKYVERMRKRGGVTNVCTVRTIYIHTILKYV